MMDGPHGQSDFWYALFLEETRAIIAKEREARGHADA